MLSSNSQGMETLLEQMWETHKEYVRRMLISLTRDIDLADDILQETYLRARSGFGGYRGGEARAWLAAIAKNAFYAHVRRKYVGAEVELDLETPAENDLLGSSGHIVQITLRQAIADLPEELRQVLLMKHYGGFTYSEIAQRLGCPQGTAQRQVFTAIRKLRETLGTLREESAKMACETLSGKNLVDYVYGKLSTEDLAFLNEHLKACPACRSEVAENVELFRALDTVESSYKMIFLMEPWRMHLSVKTPVPDDSDWTCDLGEHWRVVYAAMDGEEVVMEELPDDDPNRHRYIVHPSRAVEIGETIELTLLAEQDRWDTSKEEILTSQGNHCVPTDSVLMVALRYDESQKVVSTDPEPTELREDGHTTVYYRRFVSANEEFNWTVKYKER